MLKQFVFETHREVGERKLLSCWLNESLSGGSNTRFQLSARKWGGGGRVFDTGRAVAAPFKPCAVQGRWNTRIADSNPTQGWCVSVLACVGGALGRLTDLLKEEGSMLQAALHRPCLQLSRNSRSALVLFRINFETES